MTHNDKPAESLVVALKKNPSVDNPWALANWIENDDMETHPLTAESNTDDWDNTVTKDAAPSAFDDVPCDECDPDDEDCLAECE